METTEINKLPNTFQQNIDVNNSSQNYYSEKNQKQHADLPERDRIIDPEQLTRDENTKVNFIPDSENDIYYIPTRQEIKQNEIQSPLQDKFTNISTDELKMPIVLMLLYIIFQFPIIKNFIKNTFTFSFDEQQEITFSGIILMGFLFSASHFFITKFME